VESGLNHETNPLPSSLSETTREAAASSCSPLVGSEQLQQMVSAMTSWGDLGIVGDYLLIMIIVYILMFGCLIYQVPTIFFARVNP
jgi:hypothetical protein